MKRENFDNGDDLIADAYARLGTSLLPPRDIAVRLERAVGARRRRRQRATLAGAMALVVAGSVGAALWLGTGDDPDDDTVATERGAEARGSFVLTRPDGSTYEFTHLTLSCDSSPTGTSTEPGHIYLFSPLHRYTEGEALNEPFMMFEGEVEKIGGRSFTLPVDATMGSSDDRPLGLLVAEARDRDGGRANEVGSAEPGTAGTVRVLRASCDPTPVLELEVDTTLGSLVHQGTLNLDGYFG